MTERAPETGQLEEPVFVRGFDPDNRERWKPRPRRSRWQRHFELGRLHPGAWMKVSEVKKGGCKERTKVIGRDRQSIIDYLGRHHRLERWETRVVTLANTHCDRELYLRYLYELTPEEDLEDRIQRRQRYEARMAEAEAKKERRRQEARAAAERQAAAEQVRIRSRRRPGS